MLRGAVCGGVGVGGGGGWWVWEGGFLFRESKEEPLAPYTRAEPDHERVVYSLRLVGGRPGELFYLGDGVGGAQIADDEGEARVETSRGE